LRWYENVERKDVEDCVSKCQRLEVQGCRGRGRLKKKWEQCVKFNVRNYGMQRVEHWSPLIRTRLGGVVVGLNVQPSFSKAWK